MAFDRSEFLSTFNDEARDHLQKLNQGLLALEKDPGNAEIIEEMLKKADVSREDVDYFVLHQANRRIIEAAAKRVGVEIEKFPMNLGEYANTSAASVPILLNEMNRDGKLKRGQKIILAGFGAGLTWAGCLMEW